MEAEIVFSDSAFKHGMTEEDIRNAFLTVIYDEADINNDKNFISIGFDGKQQLIEVIYSIMDDNTVFVFHAMKCRKEYLKYIWR